MVFLFLFFFIHIPTWSVQAYNCTKPLSKYRLNHLMIWRVWFNALYENDQTKQITLHWLGVSFKIEKFLVIFWQDLRPIHSGIFSFFFYFLSFVYLLNRSFHQRDSLNRKKTHPILRKSVTPLMTVIKKLR